MPSESFLKLKWFNKGSFQNTHSIPWEAFWEIIASLLLQLYAKKQGFRRKKLGFFYYLVGWHKWSRGNISLSMHTTDSWLNVRVTCWALQEPDLHVRVSVLDLYGKCSPWQMGKSSLKSVLTVTISGWLAFKTFILMPCCLAPHTHTPPSLNSLEYGGPLYSFVQSFVLFRIKMLQIHKVKIA